MSSSFNTTKKSLVAYKGHFSRAAKSYYSLLKVKPRPVLESLEKSYNRVQKQLDVLMTAADNLITLLEGLDPSDTTECDVTKELNDITTYYDELLTQQVDIESSFAEQKATSASTFTTSPTISTPQHSSSSTPSIRVTALEPPSWLKTIAK